MEKKTLRFSLDKQALSYWSSATRSWVSDPVVFDVWVGGDSDASLHGSFSATP